LGEVDLFFRPGVEDYVDIGSFGIATEMARDWIIAEDGVGDLEFDAQRAGLDSERLVEVIRRMSFKRYVFDGAFELQA